MKPVQEEAPFAIADGHLGHEESLDIDPQELRVSALRQARWLIEFYRISAEELTAPPDDGAWPNRSAPAAPPIQLIKYRHPVTGQTWDGVGDHPAWLRKALLQDGYRVAELRVDPPETVMDDPTVDTPTARS